MKAMAQSMEQAYKEGDFNTSQNLVFALMDLVKDLTDNVFVYNVMHHNQPNPSIVTDVEAYRRNRKHHKNYSNMTKSEKRASLRTVKKGTGPLRGLGADY